MASYRREKKILFFSYLTSALLLFIFVPKNKIRHATVPLLFKQVLTWLFGLIVVEKDLIRYPYRPFFKKTYKASFDFEYFIYPVSCAIYNLYYPEKRNRLIKIIYNIFFALLIAVPEVLIVRHSRLIRYRKWNWLLSSATMMATNYLSHIFYKWFFKNDSEIFNPSKRT